MVPRKKGRKKSHSEIVRSEKNYQGTIPQIIEASGNFLNNVKKPFFVWGVLALGVLAFALHLWTSRISTLYDVLAQQNVLTEKNNELRAQQNDLLKQLADKCRPNTQEPLSN